MNKQNYYDNTFTALRSMQRASHLLE